MADTNIMAMVGAFIAVSIMLGIGVQILGNSVQDCTTLPGFTTGGGGLGDTNTTADSTGWASQCLTTNTQSQSAYSLLIIVIIVIAAVVILAVVRMLA